MGHQHHRRHGSQGDWCEQQESDYRHRLDQHADQAIKAAEHAKAKLSRPGGKQWRIQDFSLGGRRPPTQALFGENECKNERIGSCWGGRWRRPLDPPMVRNFVQTITSSAVKLRLMTTSFITLPAMSVKSSERKFSVVNTLIWLS